MANFVITADCRRGCAFCFARIGPWEPAYPARAMTLEEVRLALEKPSALNRRERGVVGGEPLLHPQLPEIIRMFWERDLLPKIFTSGTCPLPERLVAMRDEGKMHFVVNMGPAESYTPGQRTNLETFLKVFGPKASPGYTIASPDADATFLLDRVDEYRMLRMVRLGISLPGPAGDNDYIAPERYRDVAQFVLRLAKIAAQRRIGLGLDCGFVACMFSPSEIGVLQSLGMRLAFACRPVVDIGPGPEAWHCFPLARIGRVSLADCDGLDEVSRRLGAKADEIRSRHGKGIYPRCEACVYLRRGQCGGGCAKLIAIRSGVAAGDTNA